jgi:hypothetical protein
MSHMASQNALVCDYSEGYNLILLAAAKPNKQVNFYVSHLRVSLILGSYTPVIIIPFSYSYLNLPY